MNMNMNMNSDADKYLLLCLTDSCKDFGRPVATTVTNTDKESLMNYIDFLNHQKALIEEFLINLGNDERKLLLDII